MMTRKEFWDFCDWQKTKMEVPTCADAIYNAILKRDEVTITALTRALSPVEIVGMWANLMNRWLSGAASTTPKEHVIHADYANTVIGTEVLFALGALVAEYQEEVRKNGAIISGESGA